VCEQVIPRPSVVSDYNYSKRRLCMRRSVDPGPFVVQVGAGNESGQRLCPCHIPDKNIREVFAVTGLLLVLSWLLVILL
jgi:hypothetical protein